MSMPTVKIDRWNRVLSPADFPKGSGAFQGGNLRIRVPICGLFVFTGPIDPSDGYCFEHGEFSPLRACSEGMRGLEPLLRVLCQQSTQNDQ